MKNKIVENVERRENLDGSNQRIAVEFINGHVIEKPITGSIPPLVDEAVEDFKENYEFDIRNWEDLDLLVDMYDEIERVDVLYGKKRCEFKVKGIKEPVSFSGFDLDLKEAAEKAIESVEDLSDSEKIDVYIERCKREWPNLEMQDRSKFITRGIRVTVGPDHVNVSMSGYRSTFVNRIYDHDVVGAIKESMRELRERAQERLKDTQDEINRIDEALKA